MQYTHTCKDRQIVIRIKDTQSQEFILLFVLELDDKCKIIYRRYRRHAQTDGKHNAGAAAVYDFASKSYT